MPRFSQRRMRKNRRTKRTRISRGRGRSRRGGAITIPDTGLNEPITIYYSSRPGNPSKPVRLTTIKTNNPNTPFICEIVDNNSLDKKTIIEDCNLLRKNAYSFDDYAKIQEKNRQNLLELTKAERDPIVNKANELFKTSPGASERYNGGSKYLKNKQTQKRRRR